ncbi:MAG: efflux RND transporter permease subunit [Planctomycetaceae bacterium]
MANKMEGSDPPSHLLQRLDRWGNRRAFWVLAGLLFSLPVIASSLRSLRMDNDVNQWLPSDDPQMQILEWFGQEFGHEDYVLASWDGCELGDPRIDTFVRLLSPPDGTDVQPEGNAGILRVTTPQQLLDEMRRNGVSEEKGRQRLSGVLLGLDSRPLAALSLQVDERQASARQIIGRIREAAKLAGVDETALHLGGGLVARVELDRSVATSNWNPSAPWWLPHERSPMGMSIVLGVVFALLLLRSVRLTVMVLAVSAYTAVFSMALIPWCGSSLNMVLVVLPTLLMVLTLSGAIHMANYWKHAAAEDRATAVSKAIRMAAQPCFLAVITTAIGMITLVTSPLKPVRDFGIFSAIGVMLSLGMVLWGLPTLLLLWPPKEIKLSTSGSNFWADLGRWLARNKTWAGWTCVLVTFGATAGLYYFQTETKIIRFFPDNSALVQDYKFLEHNLAGINPINVVLAFDAEARERLDVLGRLELVRRVEQSLREHPEISGALSLADFRPTLELPPKDAPFVAKARYQRTLHDMRKHIEDDFANSRTLAQTVDYPISITVDGETFRVRNADEVWRVKASVRALTDADYAPLIADVEARTAKVLQGEPGVTRVVTGMVPLFLRTQEALLTSLIQSFGLAFLLIQIILVILLRGIRAGTLAMLPNVFPVTLVFGLIAWCGMAVDIGSMVTASVALGIAIDGTVHLLTWFEDGLRKGMSRSEAIAQSLGHCGPAMWHTTVIICSGLLCLMGADLLLVSRFGWLMAALVFAALIGDVIYLPTLMAGSLGQLIETQIQQEQKANGTSLPDPTVDVFPAAVPLSAVNASAESVVSTRPVGKLRTRI